MATIKEYIGVIFNKDVWISVTADSLTWRETIKFVFTPGYKLLIKFTFISLLLTVPLFFVSGWIFVLFCIGLFGYLFKFVVRLFAVKYLWVLLSEHNNFINNREYILAVLSIEDGGAWLGYASNELKNDKELILIALEESIHNSRFMGDELKTDRKFVLDILGRNGETLEYFLDDRTDDREYILTAIKTYPVAIRFGTEELQKNREFVKEAIKINSEVSDYIDDDLKNEYEETIKTARVNFYKLLESTIESKYTIVSTSRQTLMLEVSSEVFLKVGVDKVDGKAVSFITIFNKDWKDIETEKKDIVFNTLQDIDNGIKFEERVDWKNVYAYVKICDVEAESFLDHEANVTLVMDAIDSIIQRLK